MFQKGKFTIGQKEINLNKDDEEPETPEEPDGGDGGDDTNEEKTTKRTSGGVTGNILELKIIGISLFLIRPIIVIINVQILMM